MRPKSPTIQSPPMSPVNHRMPSSPKSPRKKLQSMALMNNIGQLVDSEQQQINRQLNKQQNKISLFSSDSPVSLFYFFLFKFQAFFTDNSKNFETKSK
jgi:hypothetical protein